MKNWTLNISAVDKQIVVNPDASIPTKTPAEVLKSNINHPNNNPKNTFNPNVQGDNNRDRTDPRSAENLSANMRAAHGPIDVTTSVLGYVESLRAANQDVTATFVYDGQTRTL